jgi:hypothetical protein
VIQQVDQLAAVIRSEKGFLFHEYRHRPSDPGITDHGPVVR